MGLRRYNKLDADSLAKLMTMPEVEEWTQEEPMDYRAMKQMMGKALSSPKMYMFGRDPRREVFVFMPLHLATYTVHVALHPDNRDQKALEAMQEAAGIMFEKTNCENLLTFVAEDHAACCAFVSMCGMKKIGQTEKTFPRKGEVIDEIIYQGTKERYGELKWQS